MYVGTHAPSDIYWVVLGVYVCACPRCIWSCGMVQAAMAIIIYKTILHYYGSHRSGPRYPVAKL